MIVRKFILRNSNGQYIDFLDNLDIFAISPQGLGVDFENDLVDAGASFLINKRGYQVPKVSFHVLFGAVDNDPYEAYSRLVEVMAHPPYTLEYITPVGHWERSCIPSKLSKSEIGQLNILAEEFSVECLTPWYRWKEDRGEPPKDQKGDGKIYRKHTNWKYPENAYTEPPTSYTAKDFWDYDDSQLYFGKNMLNKGVRKYGISLPSDTTLVDFEYITLTNANLVTNRNSYKASMLVDATDSKRDVHPYFRVKDGDSVYRSVAGKIVRAGTKEYVTIPLTKAGAEIVGRQLVLSIKAEDGGNVGDKVYISKAKIAPYITEWSMTEDNWQPITDKFNISTMPETEYTRYETYSTSDGKDDAIKSYNVVPSIYDRTRDYIYEAQYKLDYTFKNWEVEHVILQQADVQALLGQNTIYGMNINNYNSDDSVRMRCEVRNEYGEVLKTYFSEAVPSGKSKYVEVTDIVFADGAADVRVCLVKGTTAPAEKMNIFVGGGYWFNEWNPKARLVSTIGNNHIESNDWNVANGMEKVEDGVYYGYIYDYIYDAQEQSGNSFLITNGSQYMNSSVYSPVEITILGPAKNPRWELLVDAQVVQTDGFNLDVPVGYKLVVSSVPNEQRAVLIDPMGNVSNVYQQQNLTMTNFIKIPPGESLLIFYGTEQVQYRYREERVVV